MLRVNELHLRAGEIDARFVARPVRPAVRRCECELPAAPVFLGKDPDASGAEERRTRQEGETAWRQLDERPRCAAVMSVIDPCHSYALRGKERNEPIASRRER